MNYTNNPDESSILPQDVVETPPQDVTEQDEPPAQDAAGSDEPPALPQDAEPVAAPESKDAITTTEDLADTKDTKNYDGLVFPVASDVEFEGQAYGYKDPDPPLRRPPPLTLFEIFHTGLHDIPELMQQNAVALSAGEINATTILDVALVSTSDHPNAIDYKQWMPTIIPDGYVLKWVDLDQPHTQGSPGSNAWDVGKVRFVYVPNTVEFTGNMTTDTASNIANFDVFVKVHPYTDPPLRESYMERSKDNPKVLFEDKHGGIYRTVLESPAHPNAKGVKLFTNTYQLSVAGIGLPIETYEEILLNILERQ